jgi:hypothetical protein
MRLAKAQPLLACLLGSTGVIGAWACHGARSAFDSADRFAHQGVSQRSMPCCLRRATWHPTNGFQGVNHVGKGMVLVIMASWNPLVDRRSHPLRVGWQLHLPWNTVASRRGIPLWCLVVGQRWPPRTPLWSARNRRRRPQAQRSLAGCRWEQPQMP